MSGSLHVLVYMTCVLLQGGGGGGASVENF